MFTTFEDKQNWMKAPYTGAQRHIEMKAVFISPSLPQPHALKNTQSTLNTYIHTTNGTLVNTIALKECLENYDGISCHGDYELAVESIIRFNRVNEKHMIKQGISKYLVWDMDGAYGLFPVEETMKTVKREGLKDWYETESGLVPDTIRCIDKENQLYEIEGKEVSYTYDYDIDQEVCQRGDTEYVRTFVTDTYEEEHVSHYELTVQLKDN